MKLLTIALAVAMVACLPTAAEANVFKKIWREVERTDDNVSNALRAVKDEVERLVREATDEVERLVREATDEVERTAREIRRTAERVGSEAERVADDVAEEAERIGRKTGLDDVDELGSKLAMVGTAVGSLVASAACTTATLGACLPVAVGGLAGSGVGSLLSGAPSGYVGVHIPTGSSREDELSPPVSPHGEGAVVGRAPAMAGLPNAVANIIRRLVKGRLNSALRNSLIEDLNPNEETLLDRWLAELVAEEVWRRTGLNVREGALPPRAGFRPYQDVVNGMVEQVLLEEEYRKWQEQSPPAPTLDILQLACESAQPCLRAAPHPTLGSPETRP